MQVFTTKSEIQNFVESVRAKQQTVGFVPTMGALHIGHLSLIEKAAQNNDVVVCSIFVNPTQFNNAEDLKKYPRTLDADLLMLKNTSCAAVYAPQTSDLYPEGAQSESFDFGELESTMEGKHRPGHFQGMATVVKRFFAIILPDDAYFGEKDFQQLAIINKLVALENLPVKIHGSTIIREGDGLAMSSRNMRLNAQNRQSSAAIYQTLLMVKERFQMGKEVAKTRRKAIEAINGHPAIAVEYVEICDAETLLPVSNWQDATHIRAFVAAYVGDVRLIDNISIK